MVGEQLSVFDVNVDALQQSVLPKSLHICADVCTDQNISSRFVYTVYVQLCVTGDS